MTANELYKLIPIRTVNDVFLLRAHVHEVEFSLIASDEYGCRNLKDFEIKYYAQHSYDGYRVWELFSVWFGGIPFMVCQEAGRDGRDHREHFITNGAVYKLALSKLLSLCEVQDEIEILNPDENEPNLTDFYSNDLNSFYQGNFRANLKVGDVVLALVSENHLKYGSPKIKTRVRIEEVRPFNPGYTYRGEQIDRRWKGNEIITDVDNGSIGVNLCEGDVIEVLK